MRCILTGREMETSNAKDGDMNDVDVDVDVGRLVAVL